MVVLPFTIDDVIYDLALSFKNIKREDNVLKPLGSKIEAGSIDIGKNMIRLPIDNSYYYLHPEQLTMEIRKEAYHQQVNEIKITSKNDKNSDFYTVYTIPAPMNYENKVTDYLYGFLVNDLRLTKPKQEYGRMLSLKDIGLFSYANSEIVQKIIKLKNNAKEKEDFYQSLKRENLESSLSLITFFDSLNIEVIDDTVKKVNIVTQLLQSFQKTNKKIVKDLNKYMTIAEENANGILALSNLKREVTNDSFDFMLIPKEIQVNSSPKVYYKDVA